MTRTAEIRQRLKSAEDYLGEIPEGCTTVGKDPTYIRTPIGETIATVTGSLPEAFNGEALAELYAHAAEDLEWCLDKIDAALHELPDWLPAESPPWLLKARAILEAE